MGTDAIVGELVEVGSILPRLVNPTNTGVAAKNDEIRRLAGELEQARGDLVLLQHSCEHSWCYQAEQPTTIWAEQIPGSEWRMPVGYTDFQIVCDTCGLHYKRKTNNYLCPCCLQHCDVCYIYERFQRRQCIEREPGATFEKYLQGRLNALIWRPNQGLWVPYCSDCHLFDFVVDDSHRGEH